MATMPTAKFAEVRVTLVTGTAVSTSSYTGAQKVYPYPRNQVLLELTTAVLTSTEAANWTNFLDDLRGGADTFNFDLTTVAPGTNWSGRTAVPFRLNDPSVSWVKTLEGYYTLSFAAIESVTT